MGEPQGIKVIFKMDDDCVNYFLTMSMRDRFKDFTNFKLIDSIAYKINKNDQAELTYFTKVVDFLLDLIGKIDPLVSGKILHDLVFHIYHINAKLDREFLNDWINIFFERYIDTNKITDDGKYMLFKKVYNGKMELILFEIVNTDNITKFIEV